MVKHTNKKGYTVEIEEKLLLASRDSSLHKDFIDELVITDEGFLAVPTDTKWDEVLFVYYLYVVTMRSMVREK